MHRVASLLIALVLCTAASPARAADKTLQVLTIASDDAFNQAQALTTALKRAVDNAGYYKLGSGDFSLEVMAVALNCPVPPDERCLEKIGEKVGTDAFVWGTMRRAGDEITATLELWQKKGTRPQTQVRYSEKISDGADDELFKIAQGALSKLMSEPTDSVGGVSGAADQPATLKPSPSPHTANESAGSPDEKPEASTSEALVSRRVLGFVSLGAGAALLGAGIYSALRVRAIDSDEGFDRYRRALREDQDVCEEADRGKSVSGAAAPGEIADLCSEASTLQTLQFVFLGLSAVATGAGIYLLVSEGDEHERVGKARLNIGLGPHNAAARLSVAF